VETNPSNVQSAPAEARALALRRITHLPAGERASQPEE
jgi:hypothetical protein